MIEQPDLFGGAPAKPVRVPLAPFYDGWAWEKLHGRKRPPCGHCQMVAAKAWVVERRLTGVLDAIGTHTAPDGSTIDLCEQHAIDHEARSISISRSISELDLEGLTDAIRDVASAANGDEIYRSQAEAIAEYVVNAFGANAADAEAYRQLRKRILRHIPDSWPTEGAEAEILAGYVDHLAARVPAEKKEHQ